MKKEQRYDWNKLKKEFQDRLKKAVPEDLKDFVGLIDSKGYCHQCNQKEVLFLDRPTKQLLCARCFDEYGSGYKQFTAIEYNDMWELAQEILFYADEAIKEMKNK